MRNYNGKNYILEESIRGDYSLIKALRADELGNVQFNKSARNFNQDMATAGKKCIVEVEEIVPVGSIDPDQVHLPSVYVDSIIHGTNYDKRVEFRTTYTPGQEV
jgi:acyl CoA:acetate/3-ketoacid CoA transferase alpha subunit